ncbi:MAG: hypothetical protein ACI8PP_001754 [Candidatus Pseudothioglobus sp.]|jgi:uncharacterized protein (DUF1330 family)
MRQDDMIFLDPDKTAVDTMAEGDLTAPVVMLNLLRYRLWAKAGQGVDGLTGREAYHVYGQAFAKLQPRFGGEPMWMGRALNNIIGNDAWDIVIMVAYPQRRQFVEMMRDPDYLAIAPMRAAALADSRLIEMDQLVPRIKPKTE